MITPSGITYDRKDIEEHLQVRNGVYGNRELCPVAEGWDILFDGSADFKH